MINKAIEFATRAHAGQFRKGTRRPYIVHPIEVGDIVSTMTQDEEIISAATIEHIRNAPREVQMVGLADKLSNMRDIDRDYPVYGEELWNRFRMKDKKIIGWYYIGIKDALKDAFEGVEAYEEYSRLVHKNFG